MAETSTNANDVSFTPREWKDDRAGATPIDAAALNRMETGIADSAAGVNAINRRVLTYLVAESGDTATQDVNGAAIVAPCMVYEASTGKTWYDAGGDAARVRVGASADEVKSLRDSVSQKVDVTYKNESSTVDLDGCTATGQCSLFNAKNAPISDWLNVYVMRFSDNPNYVSQLAVSVTGAVYVRTRVRGTWQDWAKL